jgi:hypothetical protein
MKTKTVGWAVSLVLGIALLGAGSGDDANGVAQASKGSNAADSADIPSETITTAPASARANSNVGVTVLSGALVRAPSKANTNDDLQASTSVKVTATPAPIEALGGVCPKGMTEVEGD